jgi:hypothetical protein
MCVLKAFIRKCEPNLNWRLLDRGLQIILQVLICPVGVVRVCLLYGHKSGTKAA